MKITTDYYYYYYPFESFSHQHQSMVFHWSLSDSKFSQVSRTLLSILVDLNNAVVWMVSACPLISNSSGSIINPLVTVPSAPITIGITVTFMFHSFFCSQARSRYSSFFSLSFSFTLWSAKMAKSTIQLVHFFLLTVTSWSVCISKSQRILCISFSNTDSELCIYHLFIWSNLNFLHNSQWITMPTQSCLTLYSFFTNLLHSFIM